MSSKSLYPSKEVAVPKGSKIIANYYVVAKVYKVLAVHVVRALLAIPEGQGKQLLRANNMSILPKETMG